MGEMHDAWFFVGVFLFIFLIWVTTGGPLHPIAFTGPTLAQPQELGGGDYLSLPRAPFTIGGRTVSLPGSSNGQADTYTLSNYGSSNFSAWSKQQGPAAYSPFFGTPSPYLNAVSIRDRVASASTTNEYLEIRVPKDSNQSVNITGWILKSEVTIKSSIIPKGAGVLRPGTVPNLQDIVLQPGDRAIISTGSSPAGTSFRENKCVGYYSEFQDFYPPLSRGCPAASSELSAFYGPSLVYDPGCIDYTRTIGQCETAYFPPDTVSPSCKKFAQRYFNYNGCLAAHGDDADFSGNTWRVYLNRVNSRGKTVPMWRSKHEVVRLLDTQGKTVAQFTY